MPIIKVSKDFKFSSDGIKIETFHVGFNGAVSARCAKLAEDAGYAEIVDDDKKTPTDEKKPSKKK